MTNITVSGTSSDVKIVLGSPSASITSDATPKAASSPSALESDLSIPLLWRQLALPNPSKPGESMAVTMRKNGQFLKIKPDGKVTHLGDDMEHLTWVQYDATHFFSNKNPTQYPQWEKLYQMTGAMVPIFATICPGVAIFASTLQGYCNELIKNSYYLYDIATGSFSTTKGTLPNYYDIINPNYLGLSNITERILTLESQLGLNSTYEDVDPNTGAAYSSAFYSSGFLANPKGISIMSKTYQDLSGYFSKYINWEQYLKDSKEARILGTALDEQSGFHYSTDGKGIGEAAQMIVNGHWTNLLAAAGLLEETSGNDPLMKLFGVDAPAYTIIKQGNARADTWTEVQSYLDQKSAPLIHMIDSNPDLVAIAQTANPSPIYVAMSYFLPIYPAYSKIGYLLAEKVDGWMAENDGLGKTFPTWK